MTTRTRTAIAVALGGAALATPALALGTVNGSGATFPRLAYTKWCLDSSLCNYTAKGSTGGINDLINGVVDFAGSDAIPSDAQRAQLASSRGGVTPVFFPTLLGAVTVPVNIPGVTGNKIHLNGSTVGEIFAGAITSWNDPKIAATNKGITLPSSPITVCVRADGSGTSFAFSRYLTKVSPVFLQKVNFSQQPPWGAPTLIKQLGNAGVANCVKSNQDSIGYVDLGDAQNAGLTQNITAIGKSQVVRIKVKVKGKSVTRAKRTTVYVLPSITSITAAGAGLKTIKPDLTVDLSASPAPGAYPIVTTTWVLAYSDYAAAGKAGSVAGVKQMLRYFYSSTAQSALSGLGFAPLPANLLSAATAQLAKLK